MDSNPNNVIITFGKHNGKHNGKSVSTVYSIDKSYLEWCLKQPNIIQKYPELVFAISVCKSTIISPAKTIESSQKDIDITGYNANRDYGIKYGDYINFSETTIRAVMKNLKLVLGPSIISLF
jgi:hypothetical protein